MGRHSSSIRNRSRKPANGSRAATTFSWSKISTNNRPPNQSSLPAPATDHAHDSFSSCYSARDFTFGGGEETGGGPEIAPQHSGRGPGQGSFVSPGQRHRAALRLLSTVAKEGAFLQARPRCRARA